MTHEWSDSIGGGNIDGPNAQLMACDENIKTMTGTICCSSRVLNEIVLVKNIEELYGGKGGSNVQMNV